MKYLKNILTGGVFSEHGCIHVMLAIFPFLNASIFFFCIITKLTLKIFLNKYFLWLSRWYNFITKYLENTSKCKTENPNYQKCYQKILLQLTLLLISLSVLVHGCKLHCINWIRLYIKLYNLLFHNVFPVSLKCFWGQFLMTL